MGRSVAIGLSCVLVSTVGWVDYARSQSTCNQTLPAPLTTFCPGDPASAAQVNGNFQQIVDWLQAKVGAVSAAGVSTPTVTATNVNATTVTATRVAAGGYTPPAAGWASQGTGTNGAAIYNDTSSFRTLMVVGNDSAGSGRRRVGLWDDVTVSGNMSVPSNSWDSASYTGGNAYSYGSEPTGDGWARGRNACNNIQSYSCPNGQYVCGIDFWHGCGWSWYDEVTRVRCCSL